MTRSRWLALVISYGVMTVSFQAVCAAEEGDAGVKKYGLVHNIAEDRQVEKVGGIYEPEGLDKYMKRRFDEALVKLVGIENRLSEIEKELGELKRTR